ncbi:NADH:flavin oxidoreductase/NADH oxidase family protein [Solimonas terrae]|uniref:NADH:flavin oxidoreductase/NADH oxidase family protein n=1 Tax=Solimonas terrae TaxID=1396819 RepID=A0A6M2BTL9_9GAMM|nr:NADH:flavin oxidoreductase/NADH oxidase family protein [Solimonas terrae]NGY05680.1 NADH:flavin oxidoreductase/NADH oxidase family protein [Solimonas terrae]
MKLLAPLELPNGTIIPNRLAKAAMEENMADADHAPSDALIALYRAWAEGGAGLIITGNVMVDRHAMTGPGGVVLENDRHLDRFRRWSATARAGGAQVWMQINHPGRQMAAALGQQTLAPSAVPLDLGSFSRRFSVPRAMSGRDIASTRSHFVASALLAEQAGFDGVQIHAAHGYLLSQFLSPLTNLRSDDWGGSACSRARLLVDIVRDVRAAVRPKFSVSVKLNSADFQRGGFSPDDAKEVVQYLNALKVDLIELSGGSYEAPAMQGQARDGRTLAREAYFLEFAEDIASVARMPIMVTGGIRRPQIAEQVLNSGISVVGMATALALDPHLPSEWMAGRDLAPTLRPIEWKNKPLAATAYMAVVKHQLRRMSLGRPTAPEVHPVWALVQQQALTAMQTRRYRRWTQSLAEARQKSQ